MLTCNQATRHPKNHQQCTMLRQPPAAQHPAPTPPTWHGRELYPDGFMLHTFHQETPSNCRCHIRYAWSCFGECAPCFPLLPWPLFCSLYALPQGLALFCIPLGACAASWKLSCLDKGTCLMWRSLGSLTITRSLQTRLYRQEQPRPLGRVPVPVTIRTTLS